MKIEIIEHALVSALNLLHSELESVCVDDLKEEYLHTISQIKEGLNELKKN